jgi:rRNA-processing protein FCF1
VTRPTRSPLEGIDRLVVDANNLLHAGSRSQTPLPASAVIGRLRAAIPPAVGIELVFDGAPDRGLRGERIASGLIVRHSGRRSADELIVSLVDEARRLAGPRGADNVLVVTDDRELRTAVMHLGARTARSMWLLSRLSRGMLAAPGTGTGNQRPPSNPRPTPAPEADDESTEPRRWRPGRRATVKLGNPRRGPRRWGG